jgi:alanine dehydrogenase
MPKTRWSSRKTLILGRSDIEGLLTVAEYNNAIERAFRAHGLGKYKMDPKMHIIIPRYHGEWEAMPSYCEEPETSACKWVAIREENRRKFGLPNVFSTLVYTDPMTGFPLAICDGTYHTLMRTGAAGGVSAKHLARRESENLGLVGAGFVATGLLASMEDLFRLKKVRVWSRSPETSKAFVRENNRKYDLDIRAVSEAKEAARGMDIIGTSTPATSPVVKSGYVDEGTHIAAMGADMTGKQELAVEILKRAKIYVDDLRQCIRDGEINVPLSQKQITLKEIAGTLGEVIIGKKRGRTSDKDITIFDSTGIALQDSVVVMEEYKRAVKKGVGIEKRMVV